MFCCPHSEQEKSSPCSCLSPASARDEQIPKPPLPVGVEVLVVIAPLQVIGPPVIDEIVAVRARLRARHGWIMDTYLLRQGD